MGKLSIVALDLSAYQKALDSLNRAATRSLSNPADEEVRDGVIQRFEYTYELAWKMIRRYLESEGISEVTAFNKKDLFREAAIQGLIEDPESWFSYQKARNETSHTYDAAKAAEVHKIAVAFAKDAGKLLAALQRKTSP